MIGVNVCVAGRGCRVCVCGELAVEEMGTAD